MRKRLWILILGLTFFLYAGPVQALTIGIDPLSRGVALGEQVAFNVVVSDLGDASLGTFDLNVLFDPSILSFNDATFGDPILGDQLDLAGLGSTIESGSTVSGTINLFELSLDLPDVLNALQANSFTLATLTFQTDSLGISALTISDVILGDAQGAPLAADVLLSGSITVDRPAPVPEPATLLLLGSGLVGLAGVGRRFRTG